MRRAFYKFHSYLNLVCLIILFGGIGAPFPNAFYQFINIDNTKQATGVYKPQGCNGITPKPTCVFPLQLDADADAPYWLWSTGETSQSISVSAVGMYSWQTADLSSDVVVNGAFTNNTAGFTSDYTYIVPTGSTGSNGALDAEGYYTVTTDPSTTHKQFISVADHTGNTTGARNMLIVNGAKATNANGSDVNVWQEKNLTVTPNTTYIFSVWCTSLSTASIANPAKLQFSINDVLQNQTYIIPTSTLGQWLNFTTTWASGTSTKVKISVVNKNYTTGGADFALDDFVFAPLCTKYFNVTYTPRPAQPTIQSQ